MSIIILGIESSCDETSAAITKDNVLLSNIIANQSIHKNYGGVVPEFASRKHQKNIIPVIDQALKVAKINKKQIDAVAFTNGPGLLGSLLVGTSVAKHFAMALDIPVIEINHLHAHVLSVFIKDSQQQLTPQFPYLCLLVSGGHTQIILVKDYYSMETIGESIDDAAGEAFDKAAKVMGLPYPGGPVIDKLSKEGNINSFFFPEPKVGGLNFSFSGLKTSFLYLVRDHLKNNKDFIQMNIADLAASYQNAVCSVLIKKILLASEQTGVKRISIAGGVSANSRLREMLFKESRKNQWSLYLPNPAYSTDNAAMIAVAGYFKYIKKQFSDYTIVPYSRKIQGEIF